MQEQIDIAQEIERFLSELEVREMSMKEIYAQFLLKGATLCTFSKFYLTCKRIGIKYVQKREAFDNSPSMIAHRKLFCSYFLNSSTLEVN